MNSQCIAPDRLIDFATAILIAVGVPASDARLVADSQVRADLWGHQSHGVMRLSWYVARIRTGVMQTVTKPEFVVDAGAVAVINGNDGIGQVITAHAIRDAIRRAKAHGIGTVAVRNSNHFGTAQYFTRMAPPEGCIALLTTNASPAMAPWGGRKKSIGTNPWSIAAPSGKHGMIVMDIANTVVARGKVYLARQKGVPIPLGWGLNASGDPTTDPLECLDGGAIQPMAEHKGYAISVMMDVLSGVLTGSGFGSTIHGPVQAEKRSGCGHLITVWNIKAFQPLVEFNDRMEKLIAELKSVPLATGFNEIYFPGELELRNEAEHMRDGLSLPDKTLTDLARLAKEVGLEALQPFEI